MGKGNTMSADILKLIYQAVAIADLAQDDGTGPATNITVALHTGDPGAAGTQATSEIAYTGYARINVARTTGGWGITSQTISPVAAITFGEMTGGAGGTVTHFSTGTGSADKLIHSGAVTPNLSVVSGVIPQLTTGTTITES
jgi:hypothetical protein